MIYVWILYVILMQSGMALALINKDLFSLALYFIWSFFGYVILIREVKDSLRREWK
jgi:hypothetical protein